MVIPTQVAGNDGKEEQRLDKIRKYCSPATEEDNETGGPILRKS